jgi:hypothetical protein
VDTPGFNDTTRPDLEILDILATYLSASYANGVRIHGLILLHPISDNRMTGSSLRNIEMMKAMCGLASYHNLAIVTTMWPRAPDHAEKLVLERRDAELLADGRFFGDLVSGGAHLFRHNETGHRNDFKEATSARRIVDHLVCQSDMHAPDVLRLQKEIVDEGKTLGETTAGIAVAGELYKARRAHEVELGGLQAEMNSQLARVDASHAVQIRELQADVMKQLKKAEDSERALRRRMDEMHRDEERAWKRKIGELDEIFRQKLAEKQQELLDMEESLLEIRKDMARWAPDQRQSTSRQREQMALQIAEHEETVTSARAEISNNQNAYQKFKGQTGNILNGTANGVAAGLTSGVIAGEHTHGQPLSPEIQP